MKLAKFLVLGLIIFSLFGFPFAFGNLSMAKETEATSLSITSFSRDLSSKSQKFFENIFKIFSFKKQKDAEETENYYNEFVEALNRANFTNEETKLMAKTEDNRLLLLEELIEQARKGNSDDLRNSFFLWHRLDERILAELDKLPANSETSSFHRTMVDWFDYHSKLAKQLSEENLSKEEISQLEQQFKRSAEIHKLKFRKNLGTLQRSGKLFASFIPRTQAFTCGAFVPPPFYHFGGRVTFIQPCNNGLIETVSPPCGGLMLFTYPILAANPFLWKTPIFGAAVLGRSMAIPGLCPLGACPECTMYPYEATVIYFGSAL